MILPFHKVNTAQMLVWRLFPGVVAATATLIGVELGLFQSFQSLSYNMLFRLRGATLWDERVVVVEIDDQSIRHIGQFPIARRYYTQFLNQLQTAQPSVVAFDIVFAEAGNGDDDELADAIGRLNRVVLAQGWDKQGNAILPISPLAEQAINTGHVLNRPSDDGISRSIQPYIQGVPALGVAIAQAYSLVYEPVAIPEDRHTNQQVLWINWPGTSQESQSYSFYDVLAGRISDDAFRDKIVIIGVTASGDSPLITPFDRNPPTGGVYLHAAVVSNLLNKNTLQVTGVGWQIVLLMMGGPLLSVLSSYRGGRRRLMSWVGFCMGWSSLALLLLKLNILVPTFWPIALVTLTTGMTEAIERLRANTYLQKEIKRLWSAYHSDLITQQHPSSQPLLGAAGKASVPSTSSIRDVIMTGKGVNRPIAIQRAIQLAQLADLFGRSQSLHAAIARSLSVGLIAADWDGIVWFCNPVASNLISLSVGESVETKLIPTWITTEHWNQLRHQLDQLEAQRWEFQQGEKWFEITLEPLFYPHRPGHDASIHPVYSSPISSLQKPTGMLIVIKDITAFKQAETETRKALSEALELSDLKTRFVSMASHELRTPLTVVRTSIELLKSYGIGISPEKHKDYLERMQSSISGMKKIIEDVLVLGKADSRHLEFHPELLNLEGFCQGLIEQLHPGALSTERVNLVINPSDLQAALDPNLLSLILNNLLSNALKYSPAESCVTLSITASDGNVTFEIHDHGIGIPANYQKHLFEEFQRAPNVGSIPGTGLGLSIVKRCVDLHGGTISVESDVNAGTVFRVMLRIGHISSQGTMNQAKL